MEGILPAMTNVTSCQEFDLNGQVFTTARFIQLLSCVDITNNVYHVNLKLLQPKFEVDK